MTKKQTNVLVGMKEIADYTSRNRAIIIKWIKEDNFPAIKVDGRWESNTELIDIYRKNRIERAITQEATA